MSTTMTLTMAPPAAHRTSTGAAHNHLCCPNCGTDIDAEETETQAAFKEAQRQIEDLQAQVRLLTQKATAAVDKWADYEDELHALRAQLNNSSSGAGGGPVPTTPTTTSSSSSTSTSTAAPPNTMQNRLSSFLASRKSQPNLRAPSTPPPSSRAYTHAALPPTPHERDLAAALSREQALRQQAEGKLDNASSELEELSAQLFIQANEMVAAERRARAKLEERVLVLERRDGEKRVRLERLEMAVGRVERVRGLLGVGAGVAVAVGVGVGPGAGGDGVGRVAA